MKLIIPNENPDLDGAASAYAYAEYLKKKDEKAVGAVFGELTEETQEVLDQLEESISDASYYLYSADEITLVSASSMENVIERIPQENVTEIIDHENIQTGDFSNAELEIDEEVSAAATLIAEKFREDDIDISPESATLLHAAITSAEETTERDQEAAEWLEENMS